MSRIVKPAAERKAELLDCAIKLFLEKGYEDTTIADIIERTHLSKGAFYHHYSSKEQLLDGFTERLAKSMFAAAEGILQNESLSEVARFNRFLETTSRFQFDAQPAPMKVLVTLLRPKNALLYLRVQSVFAKFATPILARIIAQGMRRREFDVPDAELAAEMVVQLASGRQAFTVKTAALARSGKVAAATKLLEQRLNSEQLFLDRLLGLPPGSIKIFAPDYTKTIVTAIGKMTQSKPRA